ncbi:MAG: hypothetical protein V1728_03145 [Candidatus Micrarchaeota archaeon]
MASTRKGYITFLLMLQWAYLLLLPLLVQTPSPSNLAGAYATERAYVEHVAFKRAMVASAREIAASVEKGTPDSPSAPAVAVVACESASKAFPALSYDVQQECVRGAILAQWSALLTVWSQKTGSDAAIYCGVDSPSESAHLYGALQAALMAAECASKIQLESNSISVSLNSPIRAGTFQRSTNVSAISPLEYEVLQ